MTDKSSHSKMDQLLAQVLTDNELKTQLLENPAPTLNAAGIEVPEGVELKVVENTDTVFHLVLPHTTSELSDDDLDKVAGGFGDSTSGDVFEAFCASRGLTTG
jgi:hypothetical protein